MTQRSHINALGLTASGRPCTLRAASGAVRGKSCCCSNLSIYAFGFYAALNALIMLVLSVLVVRARVRTQTADRRRRQPKMAAPFARTPTMPNTCRWRCLLLWALASPLGRSIWLIHGMGIPLTIGRVVARDRPVAIDRSIDACASSGMALTWIAYIVGIAGVLWFVFLPQPIPTHAP